MIYTLYYSVLEFFGRLWGLAMGLLVAIILLYMFVITGLDILYMTTPIFQSTMDKMLNGKRLGGFRLLSKSALLSLEQSGQTGEHPLLLYVKKRLKDYIIAAIVVYLLIVGPKPIIDILWNIVSPILRAVGLLVE